MRHLIMPPAALALVTMLAGIILFGEWATAQSNDGERVVASAAHCTGTSLTTDSPISLSLSLACDTKHPARTATPATIKRYAEVPTTRFVCAVHKSGSADCAVDKHTAQ